MKKIVNPSTLSWIVVIILVLVPFHAFLTVWLASAVGHYTLLRLWSEILLVVLAVGAAYLLKNDAGLRQKLLHWRLAQLIALYCLLTLLWGAVAYSANQVTLKALGYGLVVNLRFLIFFLAVWAIASKSPKLRSVWPKVLLIPASIVILVGLLQRLVLPYDVLKHFGYNSGTIFPYEDINHNIHYPRIMSTLRGANPLGTYMVLIASTTAALWMKSKKQRQLWPILGFGSGMVLVFSYSRGAWVGTVLSLAFLAWLNLKGEQLKKVMLAGATALVIIVAILGLALRNNVTFQNLVFHTQKNSAVSATSDQGHASAFRNGLHDVAGEPLGRGPGTAGPASVYNNGKTRLAENYFMQIAQEVGWLGLALFLAINVLVAKELWQKRGDTIALALLASLAGITLVNLLSHAWADNTLAYLWWGLAGVALSTYTTSEYKTYGKKAKT